MLQVNNVSITLSASGRMLVDGLSFTLNRGDRTVIIGEEGNGKSTLLSLIHDPALIEAHASFSGSISHGGHKTGYLAQELQKNEGEMPINGFLGVTAETGWRAEAVAAELGLDPDIVHENRAVKTLSGGERVKLRLLKLLLDEPDILLLDEPTNDIDIETLEWLEGFIKRFDGGVLFVSHDELLIENTAEAVIHLEHIHHKKYCRCTVKNVPYRDYINERERGFLHQEQVAKKEHDEQRKKEERWREIYEKVDKAQRDISRSNPSGGRTLKKKMHTVKSLERRLEREREELTEMPVSERQIFIELPQVELPRKKEIIRLALDGLSAPDGRQLCKNITLNIDAAEHIALTGKNGVGKTTLLRLIERELSTRSDIRAFYMPQNYFELLNEAETPVDFLAPSGEKSAVTQARTYLGSVRFTKEEAEAPTGRLSGGQKAKLMFVKMALNGYNVLILDEPTRNFSPLSNPVIRAILRGFGGCIISVSHDRKYISEVCDSVYRLTEAGLERLR